MVVMVDDAKEATRTAARFLWTTFTRFEPAADLHAARREVIRNHVALEAPVAIDARLKPGFPDELFCDQETADLVEKRWNEYFPARMVEMGESDSAHLDRR